MQKKFEQEVQYVRDLAGGQLGLSVDDTNRELDLAMSELVDRGMFYLSLAFQERWKVASPVHEPVEHETFLRSSLNPLRQNVTALKVLSPFTLSHQKFPLSSMVVEAGESGTNTVFHVAPSEVDVVYSVVIAQERVRKSSLVVIDFALRKSA